MISTVQSAIVQVIIEDDTNFLNYNNPVERMNKQLNQDL